MEELIQYEITEGNIAVLTLHRPKQMNALSSELLDALNESLEKVITDDGARVVIVTGAGEKALCAGTDLKERRDMNDIEIVKTVNRIGHSVNKFDALSISTIAAINGVAFGGGLDLALAVDIRLCADHVKLGLTETSLAIIHGAGGT